MISKEHIYTMIHTPFVIIYTFRIAGYIDMIIDILFSELPYQRRYTIFYIERQS